MTRPLAGKIALVTGAGRGIGAGIVRRLAEDGAELIINYANSAAAAEALASEIRSAGGKATTVRADVSDLAQIDMMFDGIAASLGRIDILVNNAGRGAGNMPTLDSSTPEQFELMFGLNTRGLFFVTQRAARLMPDGGSIINISSSVTRVRMGGLSIYAGSKGAVEAFTRIWSAELAPRGITVNAVLPGMIETDLIRDNMPTDQAAKIAKGIPLGRIGQPADVAALVAFLAGPGGSWTSGQDFLVTGGK